MVDLVIGGAGFVGKNLVQRLERQGRTVVILDKKSQVHSGFRGRLVEADAQDSEMLVDLFNEIRPDTVYHLAANSDIASGVADASLDFGDTLMTTLAVTAAIARVDVAKLVFASSSAIFGPSTHALREENEELPAPVSWYGKAKLVGEKVLQALASTQPQLPILIVRFPNVVGPLATHGVVFDFVRKLRSDPTRLDVLGNGHQTKPYVHVAELIDAIEFFLETVRPGITCVNIGPPDLVSVRGIVTEVCTVLGVHPEVTYQNSPFGWPGDVPYYEFDTSKMRNEGFMIRTSSGNAVRRAAQELAEELSTS